MGTVPDGKILVTGITGAVGDGIARHIISEGYSVVGLVRPGSYLDSLRDIGVEFAEGDVTDQLSLKDAMRGCRYVVHAAGIIPGSGATEASFKRVNSDGTRNVISAAESSGIDRMVHVSTVNVLPIMPGKPVDEDAGPPEHPHPGYDESKLSAEQAVLEASRDQLNAVVVNPAVVFGPGLGASSRIIRAFVRGRLPFVPLPGRSMSMVYVDDVARGCLLALKNGVRGERYILSNPPITISDFIDELAAVSGRRRPRLSFPSWIAVLAIGALWLIRPVTRWTPPVTVAGVRHGGTLYDGTRAERDLGLEYTRLHDALSDTVRWIREDER